MLTAATNGANAPRAVMWSIAQIAERDGVSKPTVSVRVKKFAERHNLTVERDGQGRVASVNVAEYDALRGRFDNPSKAQQQARAASPSDPRQSESYDEALRQKTWLEAEKRRIDLAQVKGQLIETAAVAEGYDTAAGLIADILSRIDDRADDLAAVVARDGARGLQTALKKLGAELLGDVSRALAEEASRLRAMIAVDASQAAA